MPLRRLAVICLTVLTAAPLAAQAAGARDDGLGLTVAWVQAPRNASQLPVSIRTSRAGTYEARADVLVAGRRVVRRTARGLSDRRAVDAGLGLGRFDRQAIDKAARRARREPIVVVTVQARSGGRRDTRTLTRRLRRAPFYDMALRTPDAAGERAARFSVAFDLPFEFGQVHGAVTGRPVIGTFRKAVSTGRDRPRCVVTLTSRATTAAHRPRLRGAPVRRGRTGPWRHERTTTAALATSRAPAALPGRRPWLLVRFALDFEDSGGTCAGEDRRTGIAVLRRALRSLAVRAAAPQPGPGFGSA